MFRIAAEKASGDKQREKQLRFNGGRGSSSLFWFDASQWRSSKIPNISNHCQFHNKLLLLSIENTKYQKISFYYEANPRLWAASGGLEVSNLIHIQGLHFSLINQQIIDNEQVSSLPVCTKYHQKTNGPIVIRYFDAGFWSGSDLLKEEFERRDKRQCWAAQQLNSS